MVFVGGTLMDADEEFRPSSSVFGLNGLFEQKDRRLRLRDRSDWRAVLVCGEPEEREL